MKKYNLGLVSISFRDKTPEEIIKAASAAGLCCIEWGSDIHAPVGDRERIEHILSLQKQYNLFCCSYGTYFTLGREAVSELQPYIDTAKALGTDVLRLWCGDKDSALYDEQEKIKLFADCRAVAEIAQKNGVTVCMECHPHTFTDTLSSAKELMGAVNSPAFRMYWQPNQFVSDRENIEYAEWVSESCVNVHVFNWRGEEWYPLKDGAEIWKKYLDSLGGGKGLLLEFMPDNRIESLESEASALKKITGE